MAVENGYVTVAELKGAFQLPLADTTEDLYIEMAINAASRLIDQETGRRYYLDDEASARLYPYADEIRVEPFGELESIKVDLNDDGDYETSLVVFTDYVARPVNAVALGQPFTRIVPRGSSWPTTSSLNDSPVEVTAKWGFPAVPALIRQATLLQAGRLFKRKDTPFGIAGTPEQQMRLQAKLDPDVERMIAPYFPIMGIYLDI